MNKKFEIDDRTYVLNNILPVCCFAGESSKREVFLLEITSAPVRDDVRFCQFVYKSTGHNSNLPNSWLPFCGVSFQHLKKGCVNPDTLRLERTSSSHEYGRYGHPLYSSISKFLSSLELNPSDFLEVSIDCTGSLSGILCVYESILEVEKRKELRLVSFINDRATQYRV